MWSMIPLMSRIPGSHSIPWSSVADLEKNERQSIMTESGRITGEGCPLKDRVAPRNTTVIVSLCFRKQVI